mgnify:CR=1 FL=1
MLRAIKAYDFTATVVACLLATSFIQSLQTPVTVSANAEESPWRGR